LLLQKNVIKLLLTVIFCVTVEKNTPNNIVVVL